MSPVRLAAAAALSSALSLTVHSASAQPVAAPVTTIALYSYGYSPRPILLPAGKAVTLNFVNRSGSRHDFTAPGFFAASRMIAGSAPGGKVDLAGGQSRSVTLVPRAGRYRVQCRRPFHRMFGMRAEILVR